MDERSPFMVDREAMKSFNVPDRLICLPLDIVTKCTTYHGVPVMLPYYTLQF
jgi:hypothetical protein